MKIVDENDKFDFEAFLKEFETIQSELKEYIIERINVWKFDWMNNASKARQMRVESEYSKRINRVVSCFEFKIIEPDAFVFSSVGNPNYRVCRYGDKDFFRNCIWIHSHEIVEIVRDYNLTEIQKLTDKYTSLIRLFYMNATGRDHYGSWKAAFFIVNIISQNNLFAILQLL